MTKKQIEIKTYISKLTKGLVVLQPYQTERIIEIANSIVFDETLYKVSLYKRSYLTDGFELIRTSIETEETVFAVIKNHTRDVKGFYRWDIMFPTGEVLKQIFSINSQLF